MQVSLVEAPAQENLPVPLSPPEPVLEAPLPDVVMPEVDIQLQPLPANAITTSVARSEIPPSPAHSGEPIVQARFDADYLNNPAPAYPPVSKRLRERGTVVLKVLVRPDGGSDSVLVHSTSGSRRLDDAAVEAVKRWRFVPAKRGIETVASWVLVPVVFTLRT
jgi:periplasmic protein TonB